MPQLRPGTAKKTVGLCPCAAVSRGMRAGAVGRHSCLARERLRAHAPEIFTDWSKALGVSSAEAGKPLLARQHLCL